MLVAPRGGPCAMTDALGAGYGMGRAFPADDPQRRVLHEEVHARPPALLEAPERITHLALRIAPESQAAENAALVTSRWRI